MGNTKPETLTLTSAGLYCREGDFHVDPWKPVRRAVITHAHADHARPGVERYLVAKSGEALLRERVGKTITAQALAFGERLTLGGVELSLHPAGHILGSSQVRISASAGVTVVTGDHNATHQHAAAEPFEAVPCDTLITESTFGLPIYQWPDPRQVMEAIQAWWQANREAGRTSVLPAYPLGKTQRLLAGLDPGNGPIALAGAGRAFLPLYREAGVSLPDCCPLTEETVPELKGRGLVIHSFAGNEPALLKRLQPLSRAGVSGWMQIRGVRRSRDVERGFVLSDHSDWAGLLRCVRESGARRVGVTHGQTEAFARYLQEVEGVEAFVVPTRFESGGD